MISAHSTILNVKAAGKGGGVRLPTRPCMILRELPGMNLIASFQSQPQFPARDSSIEHNIQLMKTYLRQCTQMHKGRTDR